MYLLLKRLVDLIVAFVALLVLSPILIPVCILLLLTGEHEVFYLQKRVGYKNKRFQIWKFATMLKNSPNMGTGSLTLRGDSRVLPMGKFLRKTKINELPQIVNVLIGNMSLVGPRPQMEVDFYRYPEHIQEVIYNAKPGITGIGSIVFRDEEKILSESSMDATECYIKQIAPYKGKLEEWYLENRSLYVDFLLIFLTAWVIVFPESNLQYKLLRNLPEKPKFY
ncbi:sugar transferase [Acetobacteroides hydrogenigenes]|uniref:Lipopolysaccharide/colanic/teichoic acid biosynthesis glycosyltransferase n=1 Tax=Acetobacteroides hydrogenigenes TaxID=979970 RepID=A0A4R2E663_9BACT|nr:sugar transferase [Acetobacteroides hydrogenigenes]TCN62216.1 lipopolysaccharide/colanic/teichoic acid biosynthesis glycosyltransferase [Acetobacteroides hydrogenigenes]